MSNHTEANSARALESLKGTSMEDLETKHGIHAWMRAVAVCLSNDLPEMTIGKASASAKVGGVMLRALEA